MKKYLPWLYWWLLFILLSFGTTILVLTGVFQKICDVDVTRISFLIYAIFIYFSIRTGVDTYLMCKISNFYDQQSLLKIIQGRIKLGWFMSNMLLTLGMIGTVIGFIYMLTTCFVEITPDNIGAMKSVISKMSIGMGTALYTTAIGLISSALLRLQLYNLEHYHEG